MLLRIASNSLSEEYKMSTKRKKNRRRQWKKTWSNFKYKQLLFSALHPTTIRMYIQRRLAIYTNYVLKNTKKKEESNK